MFCSAFHFEYNPLHNTHHPKIFPVFSPPTPEPNSVLRISTSPTSPDITMRAQFLYQHFEQLWRKNEFF